MKKIWDEETDMGRLLIAAKAKFPLIRSFADIAKHLDLTEQVLTNWKKRGIPAAKIFDLSEEFDCNPKWLATNKGPMKEENLNPFGIDIAHISMEKAHHINDVVNMAEDEFKNQEQVFKAVVKSAKERKKQDE